MPELLEALNQIQLPEERVEFLRLYVHMNTPECRPDALKKLLALPDNGRLDYRFGLITDAICDRADESVIKETVLHLAVAAICADHDENLPALLKVFDQYVSIGGTDLGARMSLKEYFRNKFDESYEDTPKFIRLMQILIPAIEKQLGSHPPLDTKSIIKLPHEVLAFVPEAVVSPTFDRFIIALTEALAQSPSWLKRESLQRLLQKVETEGLLLEVLISVAYRSAENSAVGEAYMKALEEKTRADTLPVAQFLDPEEQFENPAFSRMMLEISKVMYRLYDVSLGFESLMYDAKTRPNQNSMLEAVYNELFWNRESVLRSASDRISW